MSSLFLAIYLAASGSPELLPPPRAKPDANPREVRKMIARSIPYIQKEGLAWIENRKCISCHVVSFMVWSLEESRLHGISIDEKKLNEWDNWSLAGATGNGVEGVAQMILARARPGADEKTQTTLKKMAENIVATQQPEGFWKAGGQLPAQKRPPQETIEVSTMYAVLAIAALEERGQADEKLTKSREKALSWLKSAKPGVSNEWHAFRLLIEHRYGNPKQVEAQLKSLLAAQQSDGGWSWVRGDTSDALATGEVLYVMSVLGQPNTSPAIRRAWQFLIDTQRPDGSWPVKGTKEAFKTKIQPHTSLWGTAWAAIGLSKSLGK